MTQNHFFTFPLEYWSRKFLCAVALGNFIDSKLFNLSRERGLSYRVRTTRTSLVSGNTFFVLSSILSTKKRTEQGEQFEKLIKEMLSNIPNYKNELINFLKQRKTDFLANPIKKVDILDDAILGLQRFGYIINSQKYNDIAGDITLNEMLELYDDFKNHTIYKLVIGDLG